MISPLNDLCALALKASRKSVIVGRGVGVVHGLPCNLDLFVEAARVGNKEGDDLRSISAG